MITYNVTKLMINWGLKVGELCEFPILEENIRKKK